MQPKKKTKKKHSPRTTRNEFLYNRCYDTHVFHHLVKNLISYFFPSRFVHVAQ